MKDYRLYWIRRGHFTRAEEIRADGDEAAIAEAMRLSEGTAAELWCGARKVRAFETGDRGES